MRKWAILIGLILIIGILPADAQDDTSSLIDMLARVPNTSAAHDNLSYVDYQALFAVVRPDAPVIHSWQDFDAANGTGEGAPSINVLLNINGGPALFQYGFGERETIPTTMGFDLFGINRALEFGQPPNNVTLIEGDFDHNAVIAAHEARGYTVSETDGLTLLCGAEGCDAGNQISMTNIDRSNVFGGELGRSQPVLIGDGVIVSSPNLDEVEATASTLAGNSDSLADQPDDHAAAEAITASGVLTQAYFIAPINISTANESLMMSTMSDAQIAKVRAQLEADFVPLPPYTLCAIADTATSTDEQAIVALVYETRSDAEDAAALFPDHLTRYQSLLTGQSMGDMLDDRGVTTIKASIFSASSNRTVLLLTLSAPLNGAEGGQSAQSSAIYRLLINAYFARDLGWLATAL